MDRSTFNKVQHQYWVTKQTVYRKLGKKEDECIVASDACLDAKLELFKSIQLTSSAMNKILDRYQEKICFLAQEQNAMGRFLKEYGKTDKSGAGKMMIQMGKSLIYCSQQEIGLRPPLLRLYQEVETFRNRAVEDTLETINSMERCRTEYRASLNWMKNVSQELDPDTYKQMEKFRKVQTHVKKGKDQFDKLKLACLQKVDLLAAARCNMFSHALIQYQTATVKTTGKNARIYNTLATTFKGHQHFEFSVVKELAEPSKKLAAECGTKNPTEELLFDFGEEELGKSKERKEGESITGEEEGNLISTATEGQSQSTATSTTTAELIGLEDSGGGGDTNEMTNNLSRRRQNEEDLLASESASELLENLLGGLSAADQSPETENAQDTLDLGLGLFSQLSSGPDSSSKDNSTNSRLSIGSLSLLSKSSNKDQKKDKDNDLLVSDLLGDDYESLSFENNDTMALLNEILNVNSSQPALASQSQPLLPFTDGESVGPSKNSSFLPSQLLDFSLDDSFERDLLNFNGPPISSNPATTKKEESPSTQGANAKKTWYDIFADIDPIANPDQIPAVGKKQETEENRYC